MSFVGGFVKISKDSKNVGLNKRYTNLPVNVKTENNTKKDTTMFDIIFI